MRARHFNLTPKQAIVAAYLEGQRTDRDTPYLGNLDNETTFWLGFETAIQWAEEYQRPDPMEVEIIEIPVKDIPVWGLSPAEDPDPMFMEEPSFDE